MIGLERGLRHLAWADDQFFAAVAELPSKALAATYSPDSWPVGRLLVHIVEGAEWYRYCLTGVAWAGVTAPRDGTDVDELRSYLSTVNAALLVQASLPDAEVDFAEGDDMKSALRSTILTQAIVHSAEHRAQVACALATRGFAGPSLDDLDLWAFERHERTA